MRMKQGRELMGTMRILRRYGFAGLLALTICASSPSSVCARLVPVTSVSGDPTNDEGPKQGPYKTANMSVPRSSEPQGFFGQSERGWWLRLRIALRTLLLFAR